MSKINEFHAVYFRPFVNTICLPNANPDPERTKKIVQEERQLRRELKSMRKHMATMYPGYWMRKTENAGPSIMLKSFLFDRVEPCSRGTPGELSIGIWKVQRNGAMPSTPIAARLQYWTRKLNFTSRVHSWWNAYAISIKPSPRGAGTLCIILSVF